MKFTIEKDILLENLGYVTKAISNKNIIPILNGIKLELKEEGLYLTASDTELTIKSFIQAKEIKKIEKTGTTIIQSKFILDIIRKMPNNLINLELVDKVKIKIYTENNEFNLNCLDVSDYPSLKIDESKNPIIIDSEIFKNIISQTSFAVSNQESRPLLTGINIKINGNILECIATDSYRLAKKTIELASPSSETINIVIPGKNVIEFEKMIESGEKIELHIFNNKILFKYKNLLFQTNLLSGTYPDTSSLIPTDFKIIVNTKNNDYTGAIDRAALLTQSKDRNIVSMKLSKNNLLITSFAEEVGKVEEKLTVDSEVSETLNISFSSKYMLDALRTIKDNDILIMMNGDSKPIVIKSVKDETLIQLILPIKTY